MSSSKNNTKLKNTELYRLRALEMLDLRIHGKSMTQIADSFEVSIDTVERSLDYASREGLVKKYEQKLVTLANKALDVYSEALDRNDPFVAKDVIDKLVKLGDRFSAREGQQEEQGLRAYLAEKRAHDRATGKFISSKPLPSATIDIPKPPAEAVSFVSGYLGELVPADSQAHTPAVIEAGNEDDTQGNDE